MSLAISRVSPTGLKADEKEGFALTGVVPAVVNESSLAKHPVSPLGSDFAKPLLEKLP